MTDTDKLYYGEMIKRNRVIPFELKGELACFISFFITNDPDKFVQRKNPWTVLEDESETGRIFYVDQIWSDKKRTNYKYSRKVWDRLINFIRFNYPLVENIRWNRWKNNKLFNFNVSIKRGGIK